MLYWSRINSQLLHYSQRMLVPEDRYLVVRIEDLVDRDLEKRTQAMSKVLSFILNSDPLPLDVQQWLPSWSIIFDVPIGVNITENYGKWRVNHTYEEIISLEELGADTLREFGYPLLADDEYLSR